MYITRLRQAQASGKDPQQIIAEINRTKRFDQSAIEILAYVHMPNHFHFILKQITDNGITNFMHRIGTGYSKYFNERHQISGSLYQGKFQAKRVSTDEQLIHLFRYIHLNPLSAGLIRKQKLIEYPWSSLLSFVNRQKSKILTKKYLLDYFDNPDKLIEFTLAPFEENAIDEIEKITIDDDFDWYQEKRAEKKSYIKKALRNSI
jgi:putative transposase